jgi:hypothetical protein
LKNDGSRKSPLFPFLSDLRDSSSAAAMTRFLKEAYALDNTANGNMATLWGDICARGLRVGSTNEMFVSGIPIIFVILRGGWDYSSFCNAFEYQVCELSAIAVAGRALKGWPYPRKVCYPPRCIFLLSFNEDTRKCFETFLHQSYSYAAWIPRQMLETMCATNLMNLEDKIAQYSVNHIS